MMTCGCKQVVFDWAPVCSGGEGISQAVAKAMREEAIDHDKRVVFVTAYGIHDATRIQEYQVQLGALFFQRACFACSPNPRLTPPPRRSKPYYNWQ